MPLQEVSSSNLPIVVITIAVYSSSLLLLLLLLLLYGQYDDYHDYQLTSGPQGLRKNDRYQHRTGITPTFGTHNPPVALLAKFPAPLSGVPMRIYIYIEKKYIYIYIYRSCIMYMFIGLLRVLQPLYEEKSCLTR